MLFPNIDPIALSLGPITLFGFSLGPLNIHWYGLTYLSGYAGVWILGKIRAKEPYSPVTPEGVEDLVFYGALGTIIGGRIGYLLFYNFSKFVDDPMILFKIWQGGMSLHGAVLGVFIAYILLARKHHCKTFQLIDFVAPLICVGLFFGRIGNFINAELWGRTTDVPWGIIFPNAGPLPRHPSQLYEAFLEGIVIFIILWTYTAKERPYLSPTGLVLFLYGCFRFFIEFYRMPDAHIGYIAFGWFTQGQLLSIPMILIGATLFIIAHRRVA